MWTWHDPALGRFTQPDSLIPQPGSPLGWDRYAYVENNPVNYIDPTGHMLDNGCKTEGCTSKHSNWIYHISRVGSASATPPFNTTSYGQQVEESSCAGCSMEPTTNIGANQRLPKMMDTIGLVNDIGAAGLNYRYLYGKREIFISTLYYEDPNGGLYVDALRVDNNTNMNLAIRDVDFTVNDSLECTGICMYGHHEGYSALPIVSNGSQDTPHGSIPIAGPNRTTTIDLVPSGYEYNPNNHFYSYENMVIKTRMYNTNTQQYWPVMTSQSLLRTGIR